MREKEKAPRCEEGGEEKKKPWKDCLGRTKKWKNNFGWKSLVRRGKKKGRKKAICSLIESEGERKKKFC